MGPNPAYRLGLPPEEGNGEKNGQKGWCVAGEKDFEIFFFHENYFFSVFNDFLFIVKFAVGEYPVEDVEEEVKPHIGINTIIRCDEYTSVTMTCIYNLYCEYV